MNTTYFQKLVKKFNKAFESNDSINFSEEEFDALIEHFLEYNEAEKALYACELATTFFPFSSDFFISKAEAYMEIGELDEAINMLNSTYKIDKADPMYYILLSDLYMMKEEANKAIDTLHSGINECDKHIDEILANLSEIYDYSEDYEMAVITLEEAILIDSSHIEKLPKYIYDSSVAREKLSFVKKIVDNDPLNSLSWYVYGFILHKLGLREQTNDALEYSMALDEDNQPAFELLIQNNFVPNNSKKVQELSKEYLKKGFFNGIFLYLIGAYFFDEKEYLKSIKYLNKALEDNADIIHHLVYDKKFELNYSLENYKACLDNLDRKEQNGTEPHQLFIKRIAVHSHLEDDEKVKEYIEKVLEADKFIMNYDECMLLLDNLYRIYGMKETIMVFSEHIYFSRYKFFLGILLLDVEFESIGLAIIEEEIEKYPYYAEFLLYYKDGIYNTGYINSLIEKYLD